LKWKVPLFDLNFDSKEEEAVIEVIRSKWISAGKKTKEFENAFAKLIGVKHAIAVSNCTAALHLALVALDIKEGDEVIVPSLTFVATVNAVKYTGATPVFADIISKEDLTISPEDIERKITPKTKAVLIMHYGGFACNMDEIKEITGKNNLLLIEDVAHAPGAEYKGRKLGSLGDMAAFSFYSNKNITTGEGGMIVTDDDNLAQKARLLRSHGMTTTSYDRFKGHATNYDVVELGYNYRIDDIRSAIGITQLSKLDSDLDKRKLLVNRYYDNLCDVNELILPFKYRKDKSSNYIFPVILSEKCRISRDELREQLEKEFLIQTSIHYQPVHMFSKYYDKSRLLPNTVNVFNNEVSLPLYYNLTIDKVDYECISIKLILDR